jgi:hypothetical protein
MLKRLYSIICQIKLEQYNEKHRETMTDNGGRMATGIKGKTPDDLIDVKEAVRITGKAVPTLYAQIRDGYITRYGEGRRVLVSRAEVLAAQENIPKGRPPGTFEVEIQNRELIEHRENNHVTGLPYSLYKDPTVKPSYWIHCHEHHRQFGVEVQKDAVELMAQPQLWCPECCEIYEEKYGRSCKDT